MRRVGQYVRRWKRWALSGAREVTVDAAFNWSVEGRDLHVSAPSRSSTRSL